METARVVNPTYSIMVEGSVTIEIFGEASQDLAGTYAPNQPLLKK